MFVRDPRARDGFAIDQGDWHLAVLIAERLARTRCPASRPFECAWLVSGDNGDDRGPTDYDPT